MKIIFNPFSRKIRQHSRKQRDYLDKLLQQTAGKLFEGTIAATPVDTGKLRNNWHAGSGTPEFQEHPAIIDETATARSRAVTGLAKFGSRLFLTNSMWYAFRIEFQGWSRYKAPQGMVRITLQRVVSELRRLRPGRSLGIKIKDP